MSLIDIPISKTMSFEKHLMIMYLLLIMGRPRYQIVYDDSLVHLTCRCHNQSFYLENDQIKGNIIDLWRKYKDKYGIKIIDYAIMDNHIHLFVYTPNQVALSSFMQATHSRMARKINKILGKKNQVFADRYRSPTVEDSSYFEKVIQYIWNNPIKSGKIKAKNIIQYMYCSLYYRYRGSSCNGLLSSYEEIFELSRVVPNIEGGQLAYAKKLLTQLLDVVCNSVKNILTELIEASEKPIFEHLHTIGTMLQVRSRRSLLFNKKPPSLASP